MVGRSVVEGLEEDEIKLLHRDHAWFVAYAPSENPQIAIAVIVEHGEHGSTAAAPVASKMIETYLGLKIDDDDLERVQVTDSPTGTNVHLAAADDDDPLGVSGETHD